MGAAIKMSPSLLPPTTLEQNKNNFFSCFAKKLFNQIDKGDAVFQQRKASHVDSKTVMARAEWRPLFEASDLILEASF
jgi:hypothetical protein